MLPKCFPRESPQQVCPDPESKTDNLVRGMLWEPGVISAGEEQGSSVYTSGQGVVGKVSVLDLGWGWGTGTVRLPV